MAKRLALLIGLVAVATVSMAASGGNQQYSWQLTPTGSAARLRGLSVVSEDVVWASGSLGTVLRTTNAGATWQNVGPPGTATLQFRDIEALDASTAVILSIGNGTDSRIYRTTNGGASWQLVFTNTDPAAFYDCMTFFDRHRGLALSDPVNGRFRILGTSDGGQTWSVVAADMPPALPNEFAFAASGQCITSAGGRDAWIGTGGDAVARVFHSSDRGLTWTVANTPVHSGRSAGIFALAFRDHRHGLAVGGDFAAPTASPDAFALSDDSGASWRLVTAAPDEYRSGAHWVTGTTALAVGPSGSDVSVDQGRSWTRFDSGSFDTVDCAGGFACWASGEQGRVAKLVRSTL
ncbi:MAG TPA: hypothetical protein VKB07_03415 [Gaiellaceae bacterium]|nr:hypothetical protein [Gaiellaceae bacterium]